MGTTNPNQSVNPEAPATVTPAPEKNPIKQQAEIIDRENEVKKAKAEVKSAYDRKKIGIETDRNIMAYSTEVSIAESLLEKINQNWRSALEKSHDQATTNEINHTYKVQLDEAISNTIGKGDGDGYLNKVTSTTGRLSPEDIATMKNDITKNSALYFNTLASPGHEDIKEALMWCVGRGKPDQIEAGKKAYVTIKNRIPQEFPKGDQGLMPCIWMVMSFIGREERDKLTKEYFDANPNVDKKAFLTKGNSAGVFTLDEMEQLDGVTYGNEEERKHFADVWQAANDHRQEAIQTSISSYGSENIAGKWLNLGNILMRVVQAAAVITIVGNVATDITQGGKFKSAQGIWDALTKAQVVGAVGVLGVTYVANSGTTVGKILEPQGTKENIAERQGLQSLKTEMAKYNWQDGMGHFLDDEDARKAFSDYIREVKVADGELNEGLITTGPYFNFSAYLERQSKNSSPEQKGVDYAKLKTKFDGIKDKSNIIKLAKVFDQFDLGKQSPEKYKERLDQAKNYTA